MEDEIDWYRFMIFLPRFWLGKQVAGYIVTERKNHSSEMVRRPSLHYLTAAGHILIDLAR